MDHRTLRPSLLLTGARLWRPEAPPVAGWALAVRDGRIADLGPEAEVCAAHPDLLPEDLGGGTLLPGFIEGHAHVATLGEQAVLANLAGARSLQEALGRVGAWMKEHPEGWIQGLAWDQETWERPFFPSAADLDALTGDRPAALRRVDLHALWVNSAALRAAGITRDTPDPDGGAILRDASGEPTGILLDAAIPLVLGILPEPTEAEWRARLLAGLTHLRGLGFTSVCDMALGLTPRALETARGLAMAEALPIRLFQYLPDEPRFRPELAKRRARDTAFFAVQGVKAFLDGALGSRGARLLEPYADAPGTSGLWTADLEALEASMADVLAAGYQPSLHAIGDAANRAVLDLLARLRVRFPWPAPLEATPSDPWIAPRVEHAQVVAEADQARFGALGLVASIQPVHAADEWHWTPQRLGPDRERRAYPWRGLADGGALLALGSDAPIADPNPFEGIAAAESRTGRDGQPAGGWLPGSCLSRAEAIRAYTEGNALALGRRDLGVLAPRAVADLLWVDADLETLPVQELRRLRPGRLWVEGREAKLP